MNAGRAVAARLFRNLFRRTGRLKSYNSRLSQGGRAINVRITLFLALVPAAAAAATLSLDDAVKAALEHGLAAETAELERAQGRQALAEGIVAATPSLSSSYSSNATTVGAVGDTWNFHFSAEQPVVDAAVVFGIVRASRENKHKKTTSAQTIADLVLRVQQEYYALAQAQSLVASADKQYLRAVESQKLVERKYQLEEANLGDKLQAEADVLSKENALLSARNAVSLNQRKLCDLIGYDAWEAVEVAALPAPETPAELPTTVISEAALDRNPDLAVARASARATDAAYWGAWANVLPALSVSFSRGTTVGVTDVPVGGGNETRYGVILSFPVVDVASRVVEITGADLDRKQARLAVAQARLDARQRLADLLDTQDLSYRQWESASKTVELNEEAYRLKARSYELGAASLVDVLQVEADLADAERALVGANAAYWSSRAELNYVLGVSLEVK